MLYDGVCLCGMMGQYVGLSTVKQKACGNTRFLFLMGETTLITLDDPRSKTLSVLIYVNVSLLCVS